MTVLAVAVLAPVLMVGASGVAAADSDAACENRDIISTEGNEYGEGDGEFAIHKPVCGGGTGGDQIQEETWGDEPCYHSVEGQGNNPGTVGPNERGDC